MKPLNNSGFVNLLLVKLGTEPGLEPIIAKLKKLNPRVRTFGVTSTPFDQHPFDVCVSSSFEAMLGAHDEYLASGLYVKPDLYRKVVQYEGRLIRMLERVAIHDLTTVKSPQAPIPAFVDSVDDRSQLLLRMLAFWDYVFDTYEIDAVVAQNYGHNGWDAVIQVIAEARNVPYLFFHEVRPFLGSLYMHEKPQEIGELEFGESLIEEAKLRYGFPEDPPLRYREMLKQVGLEQTETSHSESVVDRTVIRKVLDRFRQPKTLLKRSLASLRRRRRNRTSIQDEIRAVSELGIGEEYVFCEVQSQPNATTAVKGWMYADQRELIAQVASNLPHGWKLVVKESDRQWSRMYPRRRNFWTQISAIPKVVVVSSHASSNKLMKSSRGLIETSYSSLALEAVRNRIPVLVFGVTHIAGLPGVFNVETDNEISDVFDLLCNSESAVKPKIDIDEAFRSFVDSAGKSTISGSLSSVPGFIDSSSRTDYLERTTSSIAAVVAAWIDRLSSMHKGSEESP